MREQTMQTVEEKLHILADSAKFDVSCSTSGASRRNTGRMGNAAEAGICHTWSADGRCISLLKVLFSNRCCYDCAYCVNRRTADLPRASFEPEELATLVLEFYRRNYIEGLFLSSAVEVSPDHTGERILHCLQLLRHRYGFAGYIHAKIIPGMSPELIHRIGLEADRLSVNAEFPSKESLHALAPQKELSEILTPMKQITDTLIERRALKGPETAVVARKKEVFAPAGQTTQMIIGAGRETDRQIIKTSENLYRRFQMKRVYYSAYVPVVASPLLPDRATAPPLAREHRLYQADWLLRFYGFTADELLDEQNPNLEEGEDPKITWALRHLNLFPMEINRATMEELLRIPGIGTVSAARICRQRQAGGIRPEDLTRMGVVWKRAKHFLTIGGKYYGEYTHTPQMIRLRLSGSGDGEQLSMFQTASSQGRERLEALG